MSEKKLVEYFKITIMEKCDGEKMCSIELKDRKFNFLTKEGVLVNSSLAYKCTGKTIIMVSFNKNRLDTVVNKQKQSLYNVCDFTTASLLILDLVKHTDNVYTNYLQQALNFIACYEEDINIYATKNISNSILDNIDTCEFDIKCITMFEQLGKFCCVLNTSYGDLCLTNKVNLDKAFQYLNIENIFDNMLDGNTLKDRLLKKVYEHLQN